MTLVRTTLTARRIRLASRFPCTLEFTFSAGVGYDNAAHRGAHLRAFNDLLGAAKQGPIQCLSAFKRLTEQFATADGRDAYRPAGVTCEAELAVAEEYLAVFDDALRRITVPNRGAALVAQRNRDADGCRRAVSGIRGAYFDAIYGARPDRDGVR